ncbi:hypothetical protein [Actinoallomurus iriomotensis]|uniref:HEAT repeat protein n=1 Tax=Actinoallomurus iriomotensis TaxID=478107 RepID=A0A9W6VS38_9ACTN|nr:hypothetical protein [Actinoallomurus iriomotensis]GLY76236.1 hypothetical protein Airi01_045030 [Actinoallomurus iriomotensis]
MFDGLDHVPWRDLTYAFRGEADMPSLLRALLDEASAAEAADDLLNELYHQGGAVCSAAVAALPYLVEAAGSPRVVCRGEVLECVGRLAYEAREASPRAVADGWTAAWDRAVPRLIALLDDPDPRVRRAVTSVLEEAVTHADTVVGALRDRWAAQDRVTRLDQVLTVGALTRFLTVATLPETLGWLRGLLGDPDEQLRFAATLALREALPGRPTATEPVLTALSGDLSVWSGSERFSGAPELTVWWALSRLDRDADAQEEICLALLGHADPGRRTGALRTAANLLSFSRRHGRLLPALRERAGDPDAENRVRALHLLAAHAEPGGPDADLFAAHLDDPARTGRSPAAADVALWGLAWSGDERCLPALAQQVGRDRPGYPLHSSHTGKTSGYPLWPPGLHQVLRPCARWAPALLPAILRRLRPDMEEDLGRTLLQTLQAWGAAAAPAAPGVARLLDGRLRHWAADTLGAIGAGAASAAPALRRLLDAPGDGLSRPYARDAAAVAVPWAYWRVTGDPGPALRALVPRLGDAHAHTVTRRLADLGPHASASVPTLRLLARALEPWTAVEAAHALAAITGDTAESGHVLFRPVADLLEGTAQPVAGAAARYLAEVTELPSGYVATIEAVLADDRRHSWDAGWAAIHDDIELRAVLR